MTLGVNDTMDIGAAGYKDGCHRSSHQHAIWIDGHPAFIILMLVVFVSKYRPGFLQGNELHAIENGIGNFRTSVWKAFALPFRCKKEEFFFRNLLCRCREATCE